MYYFYYLLKIRIQYYALSIYKVTVNFTVEMLKKKYCLSDKYPSLKKR